MPLASFEGWSATPGSESVLKSVENVDCAQEVIALAGGKVEYGPPGLVSVPQPEAITMPKRGRPSKVPTDENDGGTMLAPATKKPKTTPHEITNPQFEVDVDDWEDEAPEEDPNTHLLLDAFLRAVAEQGHASTVADPDSEWEWAAFGLRFKVDDYRPSHGGTFAVPDTGARPPKFPVSPEENAHIALQVAFQHAETLQNLNLPPPPPAADTPASGKSETATALRHIDAFLQSATTKPLVLAFPLTRDYGTAALTGARVLAGAVADAQLLRQLRDSAQRSGYTLALAHLTSARYSFDADPYDAWRHRWKGEPDASSYEDGARAKVAFARYIRTMRGERVFCGGDLEVEMVLTEENLMREAPGKATRKRRIARPPPRPKKQGPVKKSLGTEGKDHPDQSTEHKNKELPVQEEHCQEGMQIEDKECAITTEHTEKAPQSVQDAHNALAENSNEQAEPQIPNDEPTEPTPQPEPEDDGYEDEDDEYNPSADEPSNSNNKKRPGRPKKKHPWHSTGTKKSKGRRRPGTAPKEGEFPASRCLQGLRARYVHEQEWRRTAILLWKPADHGPVILSHIGTGAIMRNIEASLRTGTNTGTTQLELPKMAVDEAQAVLRAPSHLWRKIRAQEGRKALMQALLAWARAARDFGTQTEIEVLWADDQADEKERESGDRGKGKKKRLDWWKAWSDTDEPEDGGRDDASEDGEIDVVAAQLEEEKDWPFDGPDQEYM